MYSIIARARDMKLSAMQSRIVSTRDRVARYAPEFLKAGDTPEGILAGPVRQSERNMAITRRRLGSYWDEEFSNRDDRRRFVATVLQTRFANLDCDFKGLLSVDRSPAPLTPEPRVVAAQKALKSTLVEYLHFMPHLGKDTPRLSAQDVTNLLNFLGFQSKQLPDGKMGLYDSHVCKTLLQYRAELRRKGLKEDVVERSVLEAD